MNDDDDQLVQNDLISFQTNGTWECVECLSNSFQRVQILGALTDAHADLRELIDELDIPRTSLQRNLSVLEQHGWIKQGPPGYTTTTRGSFLTDIFIEMLERIQRIETLTPFLDEVNSSAAMDIDRLNECLVTVPVSRRPHAPVTRLLEIFETAEQVRGFSPVVAGLPVKRYYRPNEITGEYEFILSKNTVDAHRRPDTDEWWDETDMTQGTRIELRISDDEFPYGLFACEDTLALAAYDDLGRMTALVESGSAAAIEWGEWIYERYKQQSSMLYEKDIIN